jgi:hypothetical protein
MTVGAALTLSAAQSAFVNTMIATAARTAPTVSSLALIVTGATDIRSTFTADQLPGVLQAYMAGIRVPLAMGTATAGAAFVVSLFSSWTKLNAEALKNMGGGA